MKVKKRVESFVGFQIVKYFSSILYFSGLTALIPLLPFVLSPEKFVAARFAFGFAFGFILLGFLLMYGFTDSKKVALRTLGLITLVPGLFAVVFNFLGPRRMVLFLERFGAAQHLLENWIVSYVPKAWLLAGVYIVLGTGLIFLSEKLRR